MTSFIALGMWSEGNAPKNGEPTLGFTYTTMFQDTGRFGQVYLSKEQCDDTEASFTLIQPICSWFLPAPTNEINITWTVLS